MLKTKPFVVFSALLGGLLAVPVQSAIVSVSGGASSEGAAPAIIAAPSDALDDCAKSTVNAMPNVGPFGMVGFDEAQGVILTAPVTTDTGVIPMGAVVDSHMIFLNTSYVTTPQVSHDNVTWTFDGPVIGVAALQIGRWNCSQAASSADGVNEADSTNQLGPQLLEPTTQACRFRLRSRSAARTRLQATDQTALLTPGGRSACRAIRSARYRGGSALHATMSESVRLRRLYGFRRQHYGLHARRGAG